MRQNDINFTVWKQTTRYRNNGWRFHETVGSENSRVLYDTYLTSLNVLYFPRDGRTIQTLTRDQEIFTRYFDMQLYAPSGRNKPHIEHGIAGGLLFFDSMLKNYWQAYEQERVWRRGAISIEAFCHNGLWFSFEQFPLFAYISNTIMNHNVWKASSQRDEVEKYIHFGLKDLVGNCFSPINFWSNPLLFVLDVADSLEPYKIYGNIYGGRYDINKLLSLFQSLRIEFDTGRVTMVPPAGMGRKLKKKLDGMEDWIELKFSRPKRNTYDIIMRTE